MACTVGPWARALDFCCSEDDVDADIIAASVEGLLVLVPLAAGERLLTGGDGGDDSNDSGDGCHRVVVVGWTDGGRRLWRWR